MMIIMNFKEPAFMRIEHIAIWVDDLDAMRHFYEVYFGFKCGPLYHNPQTGFMSYFLSLGEGVRVELMKRPEVKAARDKAVETVGYAHLAMSVGSREAVDALYRRMQTDGVKILSGPRLTGDGYYEYVLCDPEGNRVEIVQ
jgi:lactoylglutathione lyase